MKALYQKAMIWCFLLQVASGASVDFPIILNTRSIHLGIAGKPEWQEFVGRVPDANRWETRFIAASNATEATLFIRQDGVRQDWTVQLNGKSLGKLFLMEADLVHTLPIPVGALRSGTNALAIVPPREPDDIFLHEIHIDARPRDECLSASRLTVQVRDAESKTPIPCRITVVNSGGTLMAMAPQTGQTSRMALRPGVIYTGNGEANIMLQGGQVTVFASRGFEYSVATQRVDLLPGKSARLRLQLRREVATPGLVSCDTHVHTLTHSRHGDATTEERMLTLAGEGIELPIATEHNLHADYSDAYRTTGMSNYFTPVIGNEVTTAAGHFNIFPVRPESRVADFRITDWPMLMKNMRETEGVRVVILNHPRNVHQNFQPFAATNFNSVSGENKRGAEFSFDAMEVLNSSAQQSDYMLVYRDWFALWNYGYRITGVGSSDGHDVSRYIVGQGRTYIPSWDEEPGRIDVERVCDSLRAGRAFVSMGLLVQASIKGLFRPGELATVPGDSVRIEVRVQAPSWIEATNVSLFANGVKIREETIPAQNPRPDLRPGEKAFLNWEIPRPAHDVHLVAIATGPGVTAPFWAIPRPYQPSSHSWEGRVIGSTNPLLLDADSDGKFTPPRDYAKQLISKHGKNPEQLLASLEAYDEAVAAQVASLLAQDQVEDATFRAALTKAAPQVQKGFRDYAASR